MKPNKVDPSLDQSSDYLANVIDLNVKTKEIYKDENSDQKPKSEAVETSV